MSLSIDGHFDNADESQAADIELLAADGAIAIRADLADTSLGNFAEKKAFALAVQALNQLKNYGPRKTPELTGLLVDYFNLEHADAPTKVLLKLKAELKPEIEIHCDAALARIRQMGWSPEKIQAVLADAVK